MKKARIFAIVLASTAAVVGLYWYFAPALRVAKLLRSEDAADINLTAPLLDWSGVEPAADGAAFSLEPLTLTLPAGTEQIISDSDEKPLLNMLRFTDGERKGVLVETTNCFDISSDVAEMYDWASFFRSFGCEVPHSDADLDWVYYTMTTDAWKPLSRTNSIMFYAMAYPKTDAILSPECERFDNGTYHGIVHTGILGPVDRPIDPEENGYCYCAQFGRNEPDGRYYMLYFPQGTDYDAIKQTLLSLAPAEET